MSRTRLEWAQEFALKGIRAFIVSANSKRPLGGNSWYARNSTDPQQIAEWFGMTPDCNWGAWLGEKFVAIDLDTTTDPDTSMNGVEAFDQLCAENGVIDWHEEFKTIVVRTPSNGYHIYFRTPRPCSNANAFPASIDVRGAQGYVVGPGSQISGKTWEVMDDSMPIMDIPEFLLDYMVSPGHKDPNRNIPVIEIDQPHSVEDARAWLKDQPPATQGEHGDDHTYETVCGLRDYGVSEETALLLLTEDGWNEKCDPPWGPEELQVKIDNSYRYAIGRPGVKSRVYQVENLMQCRPTGGWAAHLSDDDVLNMTRPLNSLRLISDHGKRVDEEDNDVPDGIEENPLKRDGPEKPLWYGIEDFAALTNIREYLVKEWLIAHGVTALLARRGTGKSTVALDLGCHLATGAKWYGQPVLQDWKVIYICGEDDEGMILNVRAWAAHENRTLPSNDRFLVANDIISLTDTATLKIRRDEMLAWAKGARCLVILDTWARATAGRSSNAQEEMDTAYRNAEDVAAALNGPMIACFHPPKDGRMTIRGSAVQEDASSGIWELEEVGDEIKLTISRAKGRGRGNYKLFKLTPVELEGKDAYEDSLEGIVPVYVGGTGDDKTDGHIAQERKLTNAWATAVVGALLYEINNPGIAVKGPKSSTLNGVADFLTRMWVNRKNEKNYSHETAFIDNWMSAVSTWDTDLHTEVKDINTNKGIIPRRLKTRLPDGAALTVEVFGQTHTLTVSATKYSLETNSDELKPE